jgi:hypothetical protein
MENKGSQSLKNLYKGYSFVFIRGQIDTVLRTGYRFSPRNKYTKFAVILIL